MRKSALGFCLVVLLCAAAPALAQQGTSELGGRVTDAQGGVLPGANIVITNEDTGQFREIISSAEGTYFAQQMTPGRYRVAAKLEGFKALDRRGITLIVGQTTTLDLQLEVGGLAETLTVTGEAPLVDVSTAEVGGHISAAELNDLPSINRNYMAFVGNVPGTAFVPSAEFLNDTFVANGQPSAANNIVMDGTNNTDDQRGSNVGGQTRAANESLQEVQVITNQFDAEWGRASGAVVNAVTKSGTNSFTGSAFSFWTGKQMTLLDYFAAAEGLEKPDVSKEEWGFTIGGPIVRNKMHFFVSLERLVLARNWTKVFARRPEFNISTQGEESAWNTLWRIDHQMGSRNSWSFRWLREIAPQFNRLDGEQETIQSYDDETDLDQTMLGTLTSVLTDTKVNTFRLGAVIEDTVHANPVWRAIQPDYAKCVPCPDDAGLGQALAPPRLDYDTVDIQAATTMDYSIQRSYSIDDTFSWFIPDAKGRHDMKFGARWSRTWLTNPNWSNMNGTYIFRNNLDPAFNAANPRSYPERLEIRVPGPLDYELIMHVYELFAQDKWQLMPGMTLSAGVRYDLEVMPYDIDPGNPLFSDKSKYPVDKNNISPRIGFVWNPDGQNKAVVRAGYGRFYDRTLLGTVDNFFTDLKYARSFTAQFPQLGIDPGPRAGNFPTDPTLNTSRVDQLTPAVRAYINSIYPSGAVSRNTGTIWWDDPDRQQPYFDQMSAGYEREVFRGVSAAVDFVHMRGEDQFLNPNLNPALGRDTVRDGANRDYPDPYGILNASLSPGEAPFVATIRQGTTRFGYSDYDALNLSMERRYANNWSLRGSYSLGYSHGVTRAQNEFPELQLLTDLKLTEYEARRNEDRLHNVAMSGRVEIPKTHGVTVSGMLRVLSGTPITIQDTTRDENRNRINFEPLPAGTYNPTAAAGPHVLTDVESEGGRNGARGPAFVQLDMRLGYRARIGSRRTVDFFGEVFNVTNRANFSNPSGDMRVIGDFLRFSQLVGGSGFPRQFQIGARLGF